MEVQDDEAAKSGLAKLCPTMQQTKYVDVMNSKWASQTCGTLTRLTSCRLNTTTRDQPDTFPAWRTSGEGAPLDGDQNMAPVEVAAGAASVEVAAGADQENASAEVAADADPAENQDPEADGWPDDNVSLAPTDPEAPPIWLNTTMSDQPDTITAGRATKLSD